MVPEAVDHVIRGLLPDVAKKIFGSGINFETTSDLYDKLKLVDERDQYVKERMEEQYVNVAQSQPYESRSTTFRAQNQQTNQSQPVLPSAPVYRPPRRRLRPGQRAFSGCFICDDRGHVKANCPLLQNIRRWRQGNSQQGPQLNAASPQSRGPNQSSPRTQTR